MSFLIDMKVAKLIGQNKQPEAILLLEQQLNKNTNDPFVCGMLAQIYEKKGEHEKAFMLAEKALLDSPQMLSMHMICARYWFEQKNEEELYSTACKIVKHYRNDINKIPKPAFYLLKILALIPKFRDIDLKATSSLNKMTEEENGSYQWAQKVIDTYQKRHVQVDRR